MSKWTPEPWFWSHQDWRGVHAGDRLYISGDRYEDSDGEYVSTGVAIVEGNATSHAVTTANATRIVACVNAMAGIPDPEAFVEEAKALRTQVADLTAQRDAIREALAAANDYLNWNEDPDHNENFRPLMAQIYSALALCQSSPGTPKE